jgi:ATP-dependent Clp protease protease subunit
LDRIDSKGGYTKENVVPCCTSCNIIKGQNLSLTETLSAVQAIKNSQQETLTRVMNDNVHIDTRTIFLFGDINEQVAVSFRQKFEFLVKINKFAPININIMSNGGDWYSALGMYDTITTSDTPVYCYGMGMVASAATIIFAAGDERVLYPHSTILIHDGTEYFEGKTVDAKQTLWEMARQSDVMYAIYEKNSNRDKEFWKGKCSSEFYVSAEEAVDLGIADRIELPKEKIR